MRNFILNIFPLVFFFAGIMSCATAQKAAADQTISFKVYGVCDDCKQRIELAAMDAKGVKKAEWDKQSNVLALVGSAKMTKEGVATSVAKAGYKSDIMDPDPEGYAKLPTCCQYVSDDGKH